MKGKFKVLIQNLRLMYRILYEAIIWSKFRKKIKINLWSRRVEIRGLCIVDFNCGPDSQEYVLIVYE